MTPPTESSPALGSPAALAASQAAFGGPSSRTPAAPSPYTVTVRGMKSQRESGRTFSDPDALKAYSDALAWDGCPQKEPVIELPDTDRVAFVDVDYHGRFKPDRLRLEVLAGRVAADAGAAAYWVTHGGGLRFVCSERFEFTAHEIATFVVLRLRELAGRNGCHGFTGIEIKRESRHPRYPKADGSTCGAVHKAGGLPDLKAIAAALVGDQVEVDTDTRDEWLEEQGWHVGKKLPHEECPRDPCPSHGEPVFVGETGVFCHRCFGTGGKAFTPYAAIIPGERPAKPNALRAAVRNFCHWPHARHVIRHHAGLSEKDARALYRALLKLWHLNRDGETSDELRAAAAARIDQAVYSTVPMVRAVGGLWVDPEDPVRVVDRESLTQWAPLLPAGRYWDADAGDLKRSPEALGAFLGSGDLTRYGYPPLEPVRFADFLGRIGAADGDGPVPFLAPAPLPFTYRTADRDASAVALRSYPDYISDAFPGIDLDYLRLLLAAHMFSQAPGRTEPVRIVATGQSGSGKTTTVDLAAELLGGTAFGVKVGDDPDKFVRAYAAGCESSPFVIADECAKRKLSPSDFAARVLGLRVGESYHRLYHGADRIRRTVPLVLTDTLLPDALLSDAQLRRRFWYVDLGAGRLADGAAARDWEETSEGGVLGWRGRRDGCNRIAADLLVSEVMADVQKLHRQGGGFADYARGLGFGLLSDAQAVGGGFNPDAPYLALFEAVMRATPNPDSTFRGQGWVVFEPSLGCPVGKAWRECSPAPGMAVDLQTITSRQWGSLTGIPGVQCAVNTHGGKIGIRFFTGKVRSKSAKFGVDVLPAGHPLLLPSLAVVG